MTRRTFIRSLGLALAAVAVAPALKLAQPVSRHAAMFTAPVSGFYRVTYCGEPLYMSVRAYQDYQDVKLASGEAVSFFLNATGSSCFEVKRVSA